MTTVTCDESPPPSWLIYYTCEDCDEAAAAISSAGGATIMPPADIPGTGRFCVCADPQGAAFGLLQPLPTDTEPEHPAYEPNAVGHGQWHELMTTDPDAALDFYGAQFGWARSTVYPCEAGNYRLFKLGDNDIGGVMELGDAPIPAWLPYFGTDGVGAASERIKAAGGSIHHGPAEVPGGGLIAVATDPQGAWFAVTGPA